MESVRAKFVTESEDYPDLATFKDTCFLKNTTPLNNTYIYRYVGDQNITANPLSLTLGN